MSFWQVVNTLCGTYEAAGTYFGVTTFSASECVKNPKVDGEKKILKPFEKWVPYIHWQNVLWNIGFIATLIVWINVDVFNGSGTVCESVW